MDRHIPKIGKIYKSKDNNTFILIHKLFYFRNGNSSNPLDSYCEVIISYLDKPDKKSTVSEKFIRRGWVLCDEFV